MTDHDSASYLGHIHHIPAGRPFAEDLVRGIMDLVANPIDMSDSMILLPNRRLSQDVRRAFLKLNEGKAQLLPRMLSIADVDEDASELIVAGWDADDLPPIIDRLERQLHLSRLIESFLNTRPDLTPSAKPALADVMALSKALADFLDQIQIAECDSEKLDDLTHGEHAQHWDMILGFLKIVTQHWPRVLKDLNKSDPVVWQNAAIAARAKAWQMNPPTGLVVVAGSTGSVPATLKLMKSVLGLERGHIVLGGLDVKMPEQDWQDLAAEDDVMMVSHPQYPLSQLLERLELKRQDVALWRGTEVSPNNYDAEISGRLDLLREAMRPAIQTAQWRKIPEAQKITAKSLKGMRRVDCYDHRQEAAVIALAMREALEIPNKTAVLITPDRRLSQMVSGELMRWGLDVPIGAGRNLADTATGQFLRLIVDAWIADFAPVPLLAMARHRLAAGGMDKAEFRKKLRLLEEQVLRGPRVANGLKGLLQKAQNESQELAEFVESHIITPLMPLTDLDHHARLTLSELVDAHARTAESLGATPQDHLAPWQGQDGVRLAKFLHRLGLYGDKITLEREAYPAVMNVLLKGEVIYPDTETHTRLAIMGNVEARMHTADLTILGGMNEGIAPPQGVPDPWMSNPMRQDFGLPHSHWRVGHTAHDAVMAMARPEVLITQAGRDQGSPTQPSRWLRRLDAVMEVAKLSWPDEQNLLYLAGRLNSYDGDSVVAEQPNPQPPIEMRPRRFSATELDTLLRDPYAIYAKRILKLKALDDLDEQLGAAERGTIIHEAFRDFIAAYPSGALPDDAYEKLLEFGDRVFAKFKDEQKVEIFWWPRFEHMARWFIDNERSRRLVLQASFAEIEGKMILPSKQGGFTITARADRIDRSIDGRLQVIDYKTGTPPSKAQVEQGRALQLLVEAVLAAEGGFADIGDGHQAEVEEIAYWQFSGKQDKPAEIKNVTPADADFVAQAKQGIQTLLEEFDDPNKGYLSEPRPSEANRYSDYKHLARVQEWSTAHDDDSDGDEA